MGVMQPCAQLVLVTGAATRGERPVDAGPVALHGATSGVVGARLRSGRRRRRPRTPSVRPRRPGDGVVEFVVAEVPQLRPDEVLCKAWREFGHGAVDRQGDPAHLSVVVTHEADVP